MSQIGFINTPSGVAAGIAPAGIAWQCEFLQPQYRDECLGAVYPRNLWFVHWRITNRLRNSSYL